MSEKILDVKKLSHRYGVNWAVKNLNLSIEKKGVYGLLGSNGAGKSTTMNIICNVLNQTEGEIFINGIDLSKNPIDAKKYIGFLPQTVPLHKELTVDEYLFHCARMRLMPEKEIFDAVQRVKEVCNIVHFSKRTLNNLSGGYQQRVGIAQSIIHNPPFVVLDEPTNGLDPNQILSIRELITNIAKEKAVLISTHILSEVKATCEYIIMIDKGETVFSGSIEEFDSYMEPSVLFISMNNPPSNQELLKIEGVEMVENLNKTRLRIHFDGDTNIVQRIINISYENKWGLREIVLEKESLDKVFAKLSGKLK